MWVRTIADELMIYAKDESAFASLAKDFEDEKPGFNKSEGAKSCWDFRNILNRYSNLKQIDIYTHGAPAYVHLDGGGVEISNIARLEAPHPGLFLGEGRILFTGCNVGEGQKGRDFLVAAGAALLAGHGGIVGGTTSKNLFGRWGLFDMRMPRWGELRLIKLDRTGKVVDEKLF